MNRNDKRYIKTDNLIKTTLIDLIDKMKYNEITVVKICGECLISKHAFYSHFGSKEELVKAVIDDLFAGLAAEYDRIAPETDENYIYTFQNITYDYIDKNLRAFHVFFKNDELINFSNRMVQYIRNMMLGGTNITIENSVDLYLMLNYMLHGDVSFLKSWVLNCKIIDCDTIKILAQKLLSQTHLAVSKMYISALKEQL